MDDIKKILAPTDLSELSEVGVRYALNLAKAIDAELTIYHVVDYHSLSRYGETATAYHTAPRPDYFVERSRRALSEFLKAFSDVIPSGKVHEKVELGTPHKSIVSLAKSAGYDLIIMSTHGRTGLSHMFLGSVTEKVVRTAPCPVLSIPPEERSKPIEKLAAVA
jgi:universal stress protein A